MYHGQKRARSSVRLFADHPNSLSEKDVLLGTLSEGSDGYFDFVEDEFEIPAMKTYYHDLCRSADDLGIEFEEGQNGLTMTGLVPIIDEDTAQFVHHFTVYLQKDCTDESYFTRTMVYAWGPGDEGFALPNDVGFPVFDGEHNMAVHMQIHYDNPRRRSGMKDSSGLRFYYTNEERTHRAGVLEVGDPHLALRGKDIPDGLTKYSFHCPGSCSSSVLAQEKLRGGSQGVTVISEFLHMHDTGMRMTNEVIRGDQVVHKAVSDVYDFDQQGVFQVSQGSYQILPGDSIKTTCYYKDGTAFGLASSDEMCIAYLMYYPAKQTSFGQPWICPHQPWNDFGTGCATELDHATLDTEGELGRVFGKSSDLCSAGPDIETEQPPAVDTPVQTPTSSASDTDSNPSVDSPPIQAPVFTEPTFPSTAGLGSGAGLFGAGLFMPLVSALVAMLLA